MFMNRLICDYRSSESDLENTRQLFFEALKSYNDFPFEFESQLKHRTTSKSDIAVNKLANDIYTILSIMAGEDYSNMKEMISNGQHKRVQNVIETSFNVTSHGDTPARHTYSKPKSTVQVSVAEFTMLKDTVLRKEADILKMKQTMQATDKFRAEQTTTIRTSVSSITVAMHDLSTCISDAVTNCKKVPDSVVSSLTETMKKWTKLS
jgi:hypothetical protein